MHRFSLISTTLTLSSQNRETKRLHSSMKRLEKEKNKAIRLSESLELKMEKERKKAVRAAGLLEAKEKRSRKLYEEAQKKNRAVGGEVR